MRSFKNKICRRCIKEYIPTGSKQYYCSVCSVIERKNRNKRLLHEWYERNKTKAWYKQYAARRDKTRILRSPIKVKARHALNEAVRYGKVKKFPCEVCGNAKSQGHHADYRKELEVIWLCDEHHREWHTQHQPIE